MRRARGTGGLGAGASGSWDEPAPETGLIEDFKQQFFDAVTKFDDAVSTLALRETQLNAVQAQAASDPADYDAWQSEHAKMSAVRGTIDTAQSAVATVSGWWNDAKEFFGLSGLRQTKQLGVLQFAIPWGLLGAITAATAAVLLVVVSSGNLVNTLTMKAWNAENVRRSQQGLPPLPKPETIGGGLFGDMTEFGKVMIWGFAAWLLLPPLVKRLGK